MHFWDEKFGHIAKKQYLCSGFKNDYYNETHSFLCKRNNRCFLSGKL